MKKITAMDYNEFKLFSKGLALVTAGSIGSFNGCTIGWGSLGNIWSRAGSGGPIATVYVHPARYTCEFLKNNEIFTVSFFPEKCRDAMIYMGSHSGRDENKVRNAGLTPIIMGEGVTYEEANLTFLCKKLYQHQFAKEELADEIKEYYKSNPKSFPPNENGDWEAHYMFIGEVIDVKDASFERRY